MGCPVTRAESRKVHANAFTLLPPQIHTDDTPHFSQFIYLLSFFVLHERAAKKKRKKNRRQKRKKKTAVCSHLNISQNTMLSNTILAIATKLREMLFFFHKHSFQFSASLLLSLSSFKLNSHMRHNMWTAAHMGRFDIYQLWLIAPLHRKKKCN